MKEKRCPKCHQKRYLTKHHILPIRMFGKNDQVIYLCRRCHDAIERFIPLSKKLTKEAYYRIVIAFINGGG